MRATIRKAGAVLLMCYGILLLNSEAKAQTQENQDPSKMEKRESNVETLQLKVEGMSCQEGCANSIDNMLKKQDGIIKSKTTFDSSTSEVQYDKSKISAKQIINLIEGRGFTAKVKKEGK